MSRTSVIAKRKDKDQIRRAVMSGQSVQKVATRFHTSVKAIRTFKGQLKAHLAKAAKTGELKTVDYFKEMEQLLPYAKKMMLGAGKDKRLGLAALDRFMELCTRLGKFSGQLVESPSSVTNVQINLFELMPVVRKTLEKFPQALAAVDRAVVASYQDRQKKIAS